MTSEREVPEYLRRAREAWDLSSHSSLLSQPAPAQEATTGQRLDRAQQAGPQLRAPTIRAAMSRADAGKSEPLSASAQGAQPGPDLAAERACERSEEGEERAHTWLTWRPVAEPEEVLARAARAGYPPLLLSPMLLTVPAGESAWRSFIATAAGTTLYVAHRHLVSRNRAGVP
jgi:hypothetical protein